MMFPFLNSGGANVVQPPDGPVIVPPNLGSMLRWAIPLAVVIGLLVLVGWLRGVYTDFLWFGSMDYSEVYRTMLVTRVWLFFVAALLFALIAGVNVYLTYRFGRGPQVAPLPEETLKLLRPLALGGAIAVIALAAIIFGGTAAARWEVVLTFMNSTPFALEDPQFGRDIGFFVFKLPLYSFIQGWLLGATIVSLLFVLGMYFVHFSLRGAIFTVTIPMQIHISVLGALLFFDLAWGYWLGVFDLVYADGGAVVGATYTDVTARIPALRALMVVVIILGGFLLANAFFVRRLRLVIGLGLFWIGAIIVANGIIPSAIQRLQVNPNELRRETPYIERNIAQTRAAFALDRIRAEDYSLAEGTGITREILDRNQETVQDIRLWDHRPFRALLNEVQFFRLYYTFPDADVDRYLVEQDGRTRLRQVMVGTREIDTENLPQEAQRWVNRKLQFTHGYGAVIAPTTEFTDEGRPIFFLKDIPPSGSIPLDQPAVYYGEVVEDFVIVNSNQPELDYAPIVGPPVYVSYAGDGGVPLSNFVRRLVYAVQFRDVNIFISGEINSESRIQYHRNIPELVSTTAPFLHLDADPYIVVSDGKLFWIQDAYTVTDRYPYSTPLETVNGEINYIRNSVKVVVDAYNGQPTFYVAEPEDPIILTYQKIFPDLFKPLGEMSADLRAHIRYPEDLFSIQAQQYLTYHMTDPAEFFNKEDQWSIPDEFFRDSFMPMEPYYLNMRLPGQDKEEFVLLLPFTPAEKNNMVAWLAARSDGENYGKIISFAFPKGVQVDGPAQVEARISQDFKIKQDFALLCTGEANCIRGNLLVIPMEDRILFAEPLYLQAAGLAFPQLKRVILADGTKVVMEPTLNEAIVSLTGQAPAPPPTGQQSAPPVSGALGGAVQQEVQRITQTIDALKEGMEQLQEAVQRFQELVEGRVQ